MSLDEANEMLTKSGAPTAQFPTIGTTVKGKVTDAFKRQSIDFKTKEVERWPNGDPKDELVVTIDTGVEDDSGNTLRRFYCSGNMFTAVRNAIRETTGRIEVGGTLAVQFYAEGEPQKGLNPPKLYKAKYTPPAPAAVDLDDL